MSGTSAEAHKGPSPSECHFMSDRTVSKQQDLFENFYKLLKIPFILRMGISYILMNYGFLAHISHRLINIVLLARLIRERRGPGQRNLRILRLTSVEKSFEGRFEQPQCIVLQIVRCGSVKCTQCRNVESTQIGRKVFKIT